MRLFPGCACAAAVSLFFAGAASGQVPAAAAFEQEDFACVQLVLAREEGAQLDLAQLQQPRYRVGARLPGQACADTTLLELPAEQVVPVLQTLRALGKQSTEPGALKDVIAACKARREGLSFSDLPPEFSATGLTLHLDACGSEVLAHASPTPGAAALDMPSVSFSLAAGPEPKAQASAEPSPSPRPWRPDSGRIDATAKREKDGDYNDDELKLRVDTTWARGPNETRLELELDYERDSGQDWDRESTGRLGRIHQFTPGWFSMYEGFLERNQVRIQSTDEDYLLLQASAGGGYRWQWDERASLRAALLWNYFYFDLLDLDTSATLDAPSVFISGHWAITPRLNAQATARLYHWPNDDTGTEIDSDVAYDLTKHLGFGLRWRYTRDGASLDRDDEDKTEMFLRYRF